MGRLLFTGEEKASEEQLDFAVEESISPSGGLRSISKDKAGVRDV